MFAQSSIKQRQNSSWGPALLRCSSTGGWGPLISAASKVPIECHQVKMRSLGWSYVDPLNLLGDSGGNYIFSEFPGRFWYSLRPTHVVNLVHTVSRASGDLGSSHSECTLGRRNSSHHFSSSLRSWGAHCGGLFLRYDQNSPAQFTVGGWRVSKVRGRE